MKEYPEKRTVTWIDDETGLQCGECEYIRADIVEELEAKLEKAVEALEWVKFGGGPTGESYHLNAVDILAELTGGQSGS